MRDVIVPSSDGSNKSLEEAIPRAMMLCEQSGNAPAHHFAGAGKMVELGSGGAS